MNFSEITFYTLTTLSLKDKMSYRTARKGCEWLKAGDYRKTGQYEPSTTELLLEEMCKSFGTGLLQAEVNPINGTKLVRESKPAIVECPKGKKRVLQFQYTRFSPLYSQRMGEVYNKNLSIERGKREISLESVWKKIEKQHEKWDAFEEVTNPRYINNLNLHRWEKRLYFAVYDVENEKGIEKRLKPFLIHEHVQFDGKLPQVHITLGIEPFFAIGQWRENTKDKYDRISIDFPQTNAEHRTCINSALSLHPLNNLRNPEQAFKEDYGRFGENYQIHSDVPRELVMGLIAGYLRKFCLDKDFY